MTKIQLAYGAYLKRQARVFLLLLMIAMVGNGCATLSPNFEAPEVTVTSIKMLPPEGFEQRFEVGLKVLNPNSKALAVQGISYSLSIDGYKVATGVTSSVPTVAPYGEASFSVPVSTSLMNALRLFQSTLNSGKSSVSYLLEAKLDLGLPFVPKLSVVERGDLTLGGI